MDSEFADVKEEASDDRPLNERLVDKVIHNFQRLLYLPSYLRSLIYFPFIKYYNCIFIIIPLVELEEEAAGLWRPQEAALCWRRAIFVFYLRYSPYTYVISIFKTSRLL